jgi:hypothetical protein
MADVIHVGETMWKRGVQELLAFGTTPEIWLEGWRRRIARGDAVAFGEHAILGCDWESEGVVCTSFQASKSFELPGIGKAVTKEIRRHTKDLMQKHGIRTVCTYSLCVDESAPKWFRLLGMEEDLSYVGIKRGPYVTRRFIRRA